MGMIDAHPALKASSPQAPPQDQFLGDDYHSGGAFQLMYAFNWMSTNARARDRRRPSAPVERFDYGTPDGYRFFLELGAAANAQKYLRATMCRPGTITWRTAPTTSTGRRGTCRRISTTSRIRC